MPEMTVEEPFVANAGFLLLFSRDATAKNVARAKARAII